LLRNRSLKKDEWLELFIRLYLEEKTIFSWGFFVKLKRIGINSF